MNFMSFRWPTHLGTFVSTNLYYTPYTFVNYFDKVYKC